MTNEWSFEEEIKAWRLKRSTFEPEHGELICGFVVSNDIFIDANNTTEEVENFKKMGYQLLRRNDALKGLPKQEPICLLVEWGYRGYPEGVYPSKKRRKM